MRRFEALLRLNAVPHFRPERLRALLQAEPAEKVLDLPPLTLAARMSCRLETAERLRETARAFDVRADLSEAERLGARIVLWGDPDYPEDLAAIPDAPLALYVRGALEGLRPAAAVVGTREPTPYGQRMARGLARELAQLGVTVVSGLARGVDRCAHEGALAGGGRTWAVPGAGLGALTAGTEPAARAILDGGGCLLSEYPMLAKAEAALLVRRNRLVAALSDAVVVVQGLRGSGALHTAHYAVGYGREVLAVPGPADEPQSEAPHQLLRCGAAPACRGTDVLPYMNRFHLALAQPPAARPGPKAAALSLEYRKILELMGADAVSLDALADGTGLPRARLTHILLEMELQGLLVPRPGHFYAKR